MPLRPNNPGVDRRGVGEKSVHHSSTCEIKTPLGDVNNRKGRGPLEGEGPVGGGSAGGSTGVGITGGGSAGRSSGKGKEGTDREAGATVG